VNRAEFETDYWHFFLENPENSDDSGEKTLITPCIYVKDENGKTLLNAEGKRVVDKDATAAYKNRPILSTEEIDMMLQAANNLPTEYFQLRAKAIVALAKKFGKRRSEIARLERSKIELTNQDLEITFSLSKKRKRGLFQYMQWCEKHDPEALKTLTNEELKQRWREWQPTEEGHKVKNSESLMSISIDDKYAAFILDYLAYMDTNCKESKFLFPSGLTVFGDAYIVIPDQHLSGSQILRILKPLNLCMDASFSRNKRC
jgi:hypothetical protein